MGMAKLGGRHVHGGSSDPVVSIVTCPEPSGQPAPKLSGFPWDDQLRNGVGGVGRSLLCPVESSGKAHRTPSGTHTGGAIPPALPTCHLVSPLLPLTLGPLPTLQAVLESARG